MRETFDFVLNDYFEWLYYEVRGDKKRPSCKRLLVALHNLEFIYYIENDENRAYDGKSLRWRYVYDGGDSDILKWEESCTVLEMLIALSFNMASITDGDDEHVYYWFWDMIANLNLDHMNDRNFNKIDFNEIIHVFLNREYDNRGNGNIFTFVGEIEDLKMQEIWTQMCWYLDNIE